MLAMTSIRKLTNGDSKIIRGSRRGVFLACNFLKKDTPKQVLFCKFCDIFKNTFFIKQFRWLLLNHAAFQNNEWNLWGNSLEDLDHLHYPRASSIAVHIKQIKTAHMWKMSKQAASLEPTALKNFFFICLAYQGRTVDF